MPSSTNAPAPSPALVASAEGEKPYVLMKRGLYWRPDAQGYTGVLAEAGRYSEAKARAYIDDPRLGVVAMLASEAGEFSPACWEETKLRVMRDRLTAAESARDEARADQKAAEDQNDALHVKLRALAPHGSCACSYDSPDDVCMHHSPALSAALARAERLEKALRPFGDWAEALEAEFGDHEDDVIAGGLNPDVVTFGDLRRALAALAHPAPAEET
jgi:hypothetical protein